MLNNPSKLELHKVKILSSQGLIADLLCEHINGLDSYTASCSIQQSGQKLPSTQECQSNIVIIDTPRVDVEYRKVIEDFLNLNPHAKTIVLTGSGVKHIIIDLFDAGLCGALLYSTPLKSVESILDLVTTGEKFMPDGFGEMGKVENFVFPANLKKNELDMIRFLSEGLTNKEIARIIGKSEVSVKLYMSNLFSKIGARSRTHAMVIAYRNGFQ